MQKPSPGWMSGWVDGWMEVKTGLGIAYSNQKFSKTEFTFQYPRIKTGSNSFTNCKQLLKAESKRPNLKK